MLDVVEAWPPDTPFATQEYVPESVIVALAMVKDAILVLGSMFTVMLPLTSKSLPSFNLNNRVEHVTG